MRKVPLLRSSLFVFIVLGCAAFLAPLAFAQTDQQAPERPAIPADATPPVVAFSQTWPDAIPPFYSIAVESSGRASYHSTSKPPATGDPYDLKFTVSEPTRNKIFDLAKRLNYFRTDFDYKRSRIAFTGTKTLVFQNGDEKHETSYNWSDNLAIQQITRLFQNMSETIEIGRVVAEKYRFDKLGVDAAMKRLEEATKDDRTAELQTIQPILSKIAKDPGMMNITRRRAELLLAKIPKDAKTTTQQ
jgi:hypothetical protein